MFNLSILLLGENFSIKKILYVPIKMYVTIKLEGNVGEIHSIKVDGEEIEPEFAHTVAPHRFVHGSEGHMKLREAVDEILKRKKEKEDRKEYYDKHVRKAVDWCKEMISEGLEFMLALNKDSLMKDSIELDPKCTRIRAIHYPGGYVEELSYPGDTWTYEEPRELYYDAPTATTMPAGYKPYDCKKYFIETIKAYEGCICVDEKLANSISESLGPKPNGCNYTVKEVKGTIKNSNSRKIW